MLERSKHEFIAMNYLFARIIVSLADSETVPLDQWSTFYREKINRLVT